MDTNDFRAGFVSIVGKPNVGKSTLMNRLIGEKLSIVSAKPQTTRMNIKGFYNTEKVQIIFYDTPGFLEPRYELHEKMQGYIQNSIKGADLIVFLTDATDFPTEYDKMILEIIKRSNKNVLGVLNKADLCSEEIIQIKKKELEKDLALNQYKKEGISTASTIHKGSDIFTISALKDSSFDEIINTITENLPFSPPLYNQEDLSDMPMRFFAQEIIREKIFHYYGEEIPYCSTVVVEKWSEEENRDVIQANIWIERDTQKSIIIGKDGSKIGQVRKNAELDIERLTGKKAVLNLWVKVKKDWRKKKGALHEFDYK